MSVPRPLIRKATNTWNIAVVESGARLTLADWGIEGAKLRDGSLQAADLTFSRAVSRIEDAPICNFGETAVLYDHLGNARFRGRRRRVRGVASGESEHQHYLFSNAWWDFTRRIYHQVWTTWIQAGGQVQSFASYNPHLILNANRTVAEELQLIIAYCASEGVDVALGSIIAPVTPPPDEVLSRDVASIITQLAAWAPRNTGWFEYQRDISTPPYWHFTPPATTVTVPMGQSEDLTIAAEDEAVASAVAIRYERTDRFEENGVASERPVVIEDVYPPGATGREDGAVSATIQLAGFSTSVVRARLLCAAFPSNMEDYTGGSSAFWQYFHPILADARCRVATPAITPGSYIVSADDINLDGAPPDFESLPRFLIGGEIAPWMKDADDNELVWQKQTHSALFSWDFFDQNAGPNFSRIENVVGKRLPVKLVATNAPAGVSEYVRASSLEEGEEPLAGLAQYLYEQLSVLEYSGTRRRLELECSGQIRIGYLLNISGGAAEWATMGALVQQVEEDIDAGQTTVTFGPTGMLNLERILAIHRNARTRRRWTAVDTQTDGTLPGAGEAVEFGRVTSDQNSIPGQGVETYYAVKDGTKKVSLDATNRTVRVEASGQSGSAEMVGLDADVLLNLIGGATGGVTRSVVVATAAAVATGLDGQKGRPLSIKLVKSCLPSDPAGRVWARLVLCSDRFEVAANTVFT